MAPRNVEPSHTNTRRSTSRQRSATHRTVWAALDQRHIPSASGSQHERECTHSTAAESAHCACINAQALEAGGDTAAHPLSRYQGLIDKCLRSLKSLADWPARLADHSAHISRSYSRSMPPRWKCHHVRSQRERLMLIPMAAAAMFERATLREIVSQSSGVASAPCDQHHEQGNRTLHSR